MTLSSLGGRGMIGGALFIELSGGLTRVNGAAYTTTTDGAITVVDQSTLTYAPFIVTGVGDITRAVA